MVTDLISELYGKITGCSKGRGGSMHLIDKKVSFMGSTAIVGSNIPIGVGLALSIKFDKLNKISCIFLGDGSIELAAGACDDRKAGDIKLLKVDQVSSIADWILITEGLSDVQVRAIVNNVEKTLKEEADLLPLRRK